METGGKELSEEGKREGTREGKEVRELKECRKIKK